MSKLDKAIRRINKKESKSFIVEDKNFEDIVKIPFPSPKLNWQLYGGLPMERITEIAGEDGSGKTTTALGFCGEAQKMFPGKRALFIDAEHTLDLKWAEKLGVDVEDLLIMSPETQSAEDIFDYIKELVQTEELSVIVLDSLPSLTPDNQIGKSTGDKTYGGISLPLTKFCRDVIKLLKKHKTSLFLINQVREDMDNPYNRFRTPGGKALRHYGALRLFAKKGSMLDSEYKKVSRNTERPVGHLVEIKIMKTKVCLPDRPFCSYTLNFTKGIDIFEDTMKVAIDENIIAQSGAWYRLINPDTGEILKDEEGEEYKFHGKEKLRETLEENPELYDSIKEKVYDRVTKVDDS